ncbi:MAG: hypothetical protein ACJ790_19420 [Myxococcaceae bacterium]
MRASLVALVALVLVLAGCGNNAPTPPEPPGGGSPDAGGSGARYRAFQIIGALDRIGINRETDSACTRMTLVSPATSPKEDGGFTAPGTWHLGGIITTDHDCADGGNGPNYASTFSAYGSVVFHGDAGYGYPATIDLHATTFFTSGDGGFPPTPEIRFDADGLAVE